MNNCRDTTPTRDDKPAGPTTVETATEARQGRRGAPVLIVLVAGLVLAMIAWGVAEMWGVSIAPPAEQTATPPAGDTAPGDSTAAPSNEPLIEGGAPATDARPSGNP